MNKSEIEQYWQLYIKTLPDDAEADATYFVEQFGDTAELANDLGQLVLDGVKVATCSSLWEWEAEQADPHEAMGTKTIILNSEGTPLCIIETTEIKIRPFNAVDAQFAYDEGEDDRTLDSWRREHWAYFSRVLPNIGKSPSSDMPLVCERFQMVYPWALEAPLSPY